MRGRHDRVEVVVDRGVGRGHVVVGRRAPAVDVGIADEMPRGDGPVGHVELHRAAAAAREVEAVVGPGRGRERRLLPVDRGDQQPVDAERALRRGVDRVEAFHPASRDVGLGLLDEARRIELLLGVDGRATIAASLCGVSHTAGAARRRAGARWRRRARSRMRAGPRSAGGDRGHRGRRSGAADASARRRPSARASTARAERASPAATSHAPRSGFGDGTLPSGASAGRGLAGGPAIGGRVSVVDGSADIAAIR